MTVGVAGTVIGVQTVGGTAICKGRSGGGCLFSMQQDRRSPAGHADKSELCRDPADFGAGAAYRRPKIVQQAHSGLFLYRRGKIIPGGVHNEAGGQAVSIHFFTSSILKYSGSLEASAIRRTEVPLRSIGDPMLYALI